MSEQIPSQVEPQQTPQRLTLQTNQGSPVVSPHSQKGGSLAAVICSILFLCVGGAGGWFAACAIDDRKQYQRYADELAPLLYYKDRVHAGKERGSNQTMRLVNHKIYQAHSDGLNIKKLLEIAQPKSVQPPALAKLNEKRFLANLQLGIDYGLYEGEGNLKALAYGKAPVISKGEYKGQRVDVEHIVPKSIAPALDNILSNLTWYPASLNQSKSDTITDEALEMAEVFAAERILPAEELVAVKGAYKE